MAVIVLLIALVVGLIVRFTVNVHQTQTTARPLAAATEQATVASQDPSLSPALGQETVTSPKPAPGFVTVPFVTALCVHPVYALQVNTSKVHINTCAEAGATFYGYDSFTKQKDYQFTVPSGQNARFITTWWSGSGPSNPGPLPGEAGMAVLLGHTGINESAVFNDLGKLITGDQALVRTNAGQVLSYSVCQVRTGISKYDPNALRNALTEHPACANNGLALITCSGSVVASLVSHSSNTAVFFSRDGVVG